jgi:hypothetical protein
MPKAKKLNPEGQTLEVESEDVPVVAISQNKAKKILAKEKTRSPAQIAATEKLKALNAAKSAENKKLKAEAEKKLAEEEEKKVAKKNPKTIIVLPKRGINRKPGCRNGLKKESPKEPEPESESEFDVVEETDDDTATETEAETEVEEEIIEPVKMRKPRTERVGRIQAPKPKPKPKPNPSAKPKVEEVHKTIAAINNTISDIRSTRLNPYGAPWRANLRPYRL